MSSEVWPDDDPRWEDEAATRPFGPGAPVPAVSRPAARSPRRWRAWVAAGVFAALVGSLVLLRPGGSRGRSQNEQTDPPSSVTTRTSGPVRLEDPPEVELPGGRRFALGHPGDWLLTGDWDCDGKESPALYRPSTGDIYIFDRWATDAPLESQETHHIGILHGRPRVMRRGPCAVVRVDPPS